MKPRMLTDSSEELFDKLFIIMNNSHTVEIMDLGNVAEYSNTINLPNTSPRYMYAENNIGYISSWGLNAIIVIDLSLMELVDTIQVHGMPEHIINYQEYLYDFFVLKKFLLD